MQKFSSIVKGRYFWLISIILISSFILTYFSIKAGLFSEDYLEREIVKQCMSVSESIKKEINNKFISFENQLKSFELYKKELAPISEIESPLMELKRDLNKTLPGRRIFVFDKDINPIYPKHLVHEKKSRQKTFDIELVREIDRIEKIEINGKYKHASQEYEKLSKRYKNEPEESILDIRIARCKIKQEDFNSAVVYLDKIINSNKSPRDINNSPIQLIASIQKAEALGKTNNRSKAQETYHGILSNIVNRKFSLSPNELSFYSSLIIGKIKKTAK